MEANARSDAGERRRQLESALEELDMQIENYEASYLKDSPYGNAVIGFSSTHTQPREVKDTDRIFSKSSKWSKLSIARKPVTPPPPSSSKPSVSETKDVGSAKGGEDRRKESNQG